MNILTGYFITSQKFSTHSHLSIIEKVTNSLISLIVHFEATVADVLKVWRDKVCNDDVTQLSSGRSGFETFARTCEEFGDRPLTCREEKEKKQIAGGRAWNTDTRNVAKSRVLRNILAARPGRIARESGECERDWSTRCEALANR